MPPRKGTPWPESRRAACTPEYLAHMSEVMKGKEPWNKGLDMSTLLPRKRRRKRVKDRDSVAPRTKPRPAP